MPSKPKRRAVIARRHLDDIDLHDAETGHFIVLVSIDQARDYFGIEAAPGEAPTLLLNPPRIVKKRKAKNG